VTTEDTATTPTGRRVGRVVANHGRHVEVQDHDGRRVLCRLHGRKLLVVCGDEVEWAPEEADVGLVHAVLPRHHVLERLSMTGKAETIVSNLDRIVAVAAVKPTPDWQVLDRYLAGAEWAGLSAAIAFNKCDLGLSADDERQLHDYAAIGYPVVRVSARAEPGVDALGAVLAGMTSVLVGQSGTGKSSLLNALVPHARAVTQEISTASEEGRHTTTHAAMHELPGSGRLIDSPGVRDYAPPLPVPAAVGSGFREIHRLAAHCKFQDCRHLTEPGCAVRAAAEAGTLSSRRYGSYRHLYQLAKEFEERFPARRPPRLR
jgi:ribosome biogenesis GTPase